jgi:hypothetical protein
MKKRAICQQSPKGGAETRPCEAIVTIGMDLGDETCRFRVLEEEGAMVDGRQCGDIYLRKRFVQGGEVSHPAA